jgi:hypothetical protein
VLRHLVVKMEKAVTEPSPMAREPEERERGDRDRDRDRDPMGDAMGLD